MEKSQVFGLRCCELLASYDQESRSWKTCQLSFEWAVPSSLGALPRSAMMQSGRLYRLPSLERRICEKDGSASLPTPRSFMAHMADRPLQLRQNMGDHRGPNLEEGIALLPTPITSDHRSGWQTDNQLRSIARLLLARPSGAVTIQPSDDGKPPPAGQHPTPPTTGNCPADLLSG